MKTKLGIVIAVLLVVIVVGGWLFSNRSQSEGELSLAGLTGKVTVFRDEKGMAYLYAQTLDDALLAQGFITAQDRLFQK